jgi:hypothetical protein
MVVNTITELNTLLNDVDTDATVLAAIANDAANATGSGLTPGYVTTRLGTEVRNVQKLIEDIINGDITTVRPAIQEEGAEVLSSPGTWNFVGSAITVTDNAGVATITVTSDVSKVGTPTDNQIGVWTGDGTIEGAVGLTWDAGTEQLDVLGAAPSIRLRDSDTTAIHSILASDNILQINADVSDLAGSSGIQFAVDGNEKMRISTGGHVGINETTPRDYLHITNSANPGIRIQDIDLVNAYVRFSVTNIGAGALIEADPLNLHVNSTIQFKIDGNEKYRITSTGEFRGPATTVAALPGAALVSAGARHFVTDATATTFASIVAGGGANSVPVYSDGTNWRIG